MEWKKGAAGRKVLTTKIMAKGKLEHFEMKWSLVRLSLFESSI